MASMKIEVSEDRELILSDVFSGIGIKTDQGTFGIAQRDGGIEIVKDGKIVWSSTRSGAPRPTSVSPERPFTPRVYEILRGADDMAAERGMYFVDSLYLLLALINGPGWAADTALKSSGNVKAIRDMASSLADTLEQANKPGSDVEVPSANGAIHADGPVVRKFDEADETPDYATKHAWGKDIGGPTCNKCRERWTEENKDLSCSIADAQRAVIQLGQCLATAEGKGSLSGQGLMRGAYGWSLAFEAVKKLWEKLEVANNRLVHIHGTVKKLEGYLLSGGRENERLEEKIRVQDKARAQMSAEYHDLVAGFKRSAEEVKELRVSLEAERAANADKVQTIYRQCQERRTIRDAVERGDMPGLREILFPPESDDPESVEEPAAKMGDRKVMEAKRPYEMMREDRDHLLRVLAKCEQIATGWEGISRVGALEAVTTLRAERDRMRAATKGLRAKIMLHIDCICPNDKEIMDPECPMIEIHRIFDDFEKQAGMAEAKGPERASDVTSPTAFTLAPGPWMKDQLVIRFDGPPGSEPGRFVEVEINGRSVNIGEWVQDGEYWLLVIRPDAIPSQEPERLVARVPDRPTDDEVIERMRSILPALEGLEELRAQRDDLRRRHKKARAEIIKRAPCTCSGRAGKHGNPHEPDCRLGIAIMEF